MRDIYGGTHHAGPAVETGGFLTVANRSFAVSTCEVFSTHARVETEACVCARATVVTRFVCPAKIQICMQGTNI